MSSTLRRLYDDLLEAGKQGLRRGELRDAFGTYERAVAVAVRLGEDELVYRAETNKFSLCLEMGPPYPTADPLRAVLLHSKDPLSRFLAALGLSRLYQYTKQTKKARFYARIALSIAPASRRGCAHHHLGINLLAACEYGNGAEHLRRALDLWSPEVAPITLPLSALAYASALLGRSADLRTCTEEVETLLPKLPSPLYDSSVHLNLGFAALESRQFERAYLHGREALSAVITLGAIPSHDHKSALYLIGESALGEGHPKEAESFFQLLTRTYFPEDMVISDLLMSLRTAPLINWLA